MVITFLKTLRVNVIQKLYFHFINLSISLMLRAIGRQVGAEHLRLALKLGKKGMSGEKET